MQELRAISADSHNTVWVNNTPGGLQIYAECRKITLKLLGLNMLQKQKLQHFVQYSLAQELIENADQGIEIDLNLLISILRSMDVAAGSINISAGEYHSFLDLELQRNNLIRIKDYPYKGGNCAFDSLGLHMHMMGHQQQIQLAQLHKTHSIHCTCTAL